MSVNSERLQYLLSRNKAKSASREELQELFSLIQESQDSEILPLLDDQYRQIHPDLKVEGVDWDYMLDMIFRERQKGQIKDGAEPVHRIHFHKTAWFRYAAAAVLILGLGAYLWNTQGKKDHRSLVQTTNPAPVQSDVLPGSDKAILTLSNGQQVALNPAAEKTITEGNLLIKNANGELTYRKSDVVVFNTMSTPKGGQYRLTLADGTKVWLNAASSITFPTAFTGKTRSVSITGEVYFEVTKNIAQPFLVDIGTATIEVLGTHFNVNTYKEEPTNNTTLLEGSVRIKTAHTTLLLKPGQQGQWNPKKENLSLVAHPDVEQTVAWKNGLFNFNETDLPTAMRQIARWYDLEVRFEGGIPSKVIRGKMGRDLNLSQVLRILKKMEIKFRLEGKVLIVSP